MPKPVAYDLFVLLDLESPDERRAGVIDQVRRQIQDRGSLKGDVDWGSRKLAYEIDHRGEAQYHLFQFEAAPELLTELDRSLSIDDAVIRHRIIRLPGEAPDTPPPRPSPEEPRREERPDRDRDRDRGRGRDRDRDRGPRSDGDGDRDESADSTSEAAPAEEPVASEPPAGEPAEQG